MYSVSQYKDRYLKKYRLGTSVIECRISLRKLNNALSGSDKVDGKSGESHTTRVVEEPEVDTTAQFRFF